MLDELFIVICSKLPDMKTVIKMERASKHHQKLIRDTIWYLSVKIDNDWSMDHVVRNYKFRNIIFGKHVDCNRYINYIKECYKLNLFSCRITDNSIEKLGNVKHLNISFTKVTDESIIFLINSYSLDLSYTKISDVSVSLLGNLSILNLTGCKLITDMSVKLLGKCKSLILSCCTKITDEGVKYLNNVENLYLDNIDNITDEGIKLFKYTKILSLKYTKVNGKYFKNLKCNEICLKGCIIHNFTYLRKCKIIYAQSTNINMEEIKYLELKGCNIINNLNSIHPLKYLS